MNIVRKSHFPGLLNRRRLRANAIIESAVHIVSHMGIIGSNSRTPLSKCRERPLIGSALLSQGISHIFQNISKSGRECVVRGLKLYEKQKFVTLREGGLEMEEAKWARWNLCKRGGGGGKSVMKRVKATPLPIMPLLKNVHTHYLHSGHMCMKRSKRDGRLEFE